MKPTKALLLAALALSMALPACGETTYEFDEVVLGEDDDGRVPRARTNAQFLRAVYADLLGRTPESYDYIFTDNGTEIFAFPLDEQVQLLNVLDGIGDSTPMRDLLITGLVFSSEVDIPDKNDVDAEEFIAEQFRKFLGRNPSVYELEAFVDEWVSDDSINPRTVIRAILGSTEYQSF